MPPIQHRQRQRLGRAIGQPRAADYVAHYKHIGLEGHLLCAKTFDEFNAQRRYRTISTRLEVYPSSRQVRRCVDWYQIERRPSGTVLTPQMRCWWARRSFT